MLHPVINNLGPFNHDATAVIWMLGRCQQVAVAQWAAEP